MTIGKPGTGAARALSVHLRIVSVALLIMPTTQLNPPHMAMPQRFGQQPRALDSEPLGYAKTTADLGERMHAVHLPAGRGANPGAVSGTGACARQMVHGRHPLPCADAESRGDGGRRRPHDGLAAPPPIRE